MTWSRVPRGRRASRSLVVVGVVLLGNPAWIGALTVYPGTGWAFIPLFHAAISALGLLAAAVGLGSLRSGRRTPSPRLVALVTVGAVVVVPLYGVLIEGTVGPDGPSLAGYGFRRAFVASLVSAVFLIGYGLASRRREMRMLGLLLPVFPAVLVVIEWRSGALLEPVLDAYYLLAGGPLLGVRYLGSVLLLATFVFGVWIGWTGQTERTS